MVIHSKKIKVANIIEEGKLGGPQIRIINIAVGISESVDTTVILPKSNSKIFQAKLRDVGVNYFALSLSRITKEPLVMLRYVFLSWYEILRLVKFIKKNKFDIVHVSGGAWQYKGVLAGWLTNTKVVWHLNDTSLPWLFRKMFSIFSNMPDAYIFASERTREYYQNLISRDKPGFVIPAPVDSQYFSPKLDFQMDTDLISEWDGKIVIGTVANINPIKGLDMLIRVAENINKLSDEMVFVCVGPVFENQRKYYEKLLNQMTGLGILNVEFVGGRDDPRGLISRFDIYICTSYAESSPVSVWEAMSMGKPVLSTDVGDVPLYVRDSIEGGIVNVGDDEAFSRKLIELVQDKDKREEYGANARKVILEKLDLSHCSSKQVECYNVVHSL